MKYIVDNINILIERVKQYQRSIDCNVHEIISSNIPDSVLLDIHKDLIENRSGTYRIVFKIDGNQPPAINGYYHLYDSDDIRFENLLTMHLNIRDYNLNQLI